MPEHYQPPVGTAHVLLAWVGTLLTLGYMLPWAIAASRHKSNTGAIGVLTLLTGWSVIGWFVALVMACAAEPRYTPHPPTR